MFRKQRGVALKGLLFWGILIALVVIIGMRVVPSMVEFMAIRKDVKAVVAGLPAEATVSDAIKSFDRYADVDYITSIKGADLEITKESGVIVINFAYTKKISLGGNVSLVIDYAGSSKNK